MDKRLVAISTIFVLPLVTACQAGSPIAYQGFDFDAPDNGVYVASEEFVKACGSWSKLDLVVGDVKGEESIYYCSEESSPNLFMYKGVYSPDLETLKASPYYLTQGEDKSEVFVHEVNREISIEPAFTEGSGYGGSLYEDPLAKFEDDVEDPEGVLATVSDIEGDEWLEHSEEILVGARGTALVAGVLYKSTKEAKRSLQVKYGDFSKVKVPDEIKKDVSRVGYSNGTYFSSKDNIKSSAYNISKDTFAKPESSLVKTAKKTTASGAKGGMSTTGGGGIA